MKKTMMSALFGVCAALFFGTALGQGDVARGKVLAQPCAACHGADGNSAVAMYPKLAGQHAGYLREQMHAFKKGAKGGRGGPNAALMYGLVAKLSDQDIDDLAAYFASEETAPGGTEKKWIEVGRAIYKGGNPTSGVAACAGCHGPRGLGNAEARFPKLSGQQAAYIEAQLKAFRAGQRSNDINKVMQSIAARMSDEEITAVSHYVSGLH